MSSVFYKHNKTIISNRGMIPDVASIGLGLKKVNTRRIIKLRSCVDDKKVYFRCKRIVDVVVSVLMIVFVLSWLSPLLAILITLSSPGPVLFTQRRVGKAGKTFLCFKFRTMIVNPEADIKRADLDDRRVTAIGKFLRRYNVDELPQFINVLLGHMSIVGPRPHMHADCAAFSSMIPGYKFRNFVKPGITGLAQANGYHGPASSEDLLKKRFQLDAFYVRNASVKLDVKILRTTVSRRLKLLINNS